MRRRIKNRILHSWHFMRGSEERQSSMVVSPTFRRRRPGPSAIEPLEEGCDEGELAAEAGAWLRKFILPAVARGDLVDEDSRAFGLWLSTQAKLTEQTLHQILLARGEAGGRTYVAVHRNFYRRANRMFRVIKVGLILEGRPIRPAPPEWEE